MLCLLPLLSKTRMEKEQQKNLTKLVCQLEDFSDEKFNNSQTVNFVSHSMLTF